MILPTPRFFVLYGEGVIRLTKFRLPRSLNAKILYMLIFSFVCAGALFVLISGIGKYFVDNVYMSPASVSSRNAEIYAAFNSFVKSNNIKAEDSAAIAAWDNYGEYVDISVYRPDEEKPVSNTLPNSFISPPKMHSLPSVSQYSGQHGKLYPMRFSDGLFYIAIDDNTYTRELMLNNIAAILAASIIFLLVILTYVRRLTNRIIRLSGEALEIGAGDLDHPISVQGDDELSVLAQEMDNMRRSVIERMGNEKKAWQANSELITAISHDIRTPMTSLIGYLGLLNDSDFSDAERSRQFSASAYGKAMELKDLTDELFRYFLVFGRADLEMNMENYDGQLLLSEAEFDLIEKGFDVQHIDFEGECSIVTDPLYLKRVMDNIVSNIKKYADKAYPVMVITELRDNQLSVCLSNHTAKLANRVESTKIGIRTCQKIIEHMGGSFITRSDENHFASEFTLPAEIKKA